MNPQRQAHWSLAKNGGGIISNKSEGITLSGAVGDEAESYYGGTLVGESMQDDVAKMIIADHEFCKLLTENDRDRIADMLWWMKGYKEGSDKSFNGCPFIEEHFEVLRKLVTTWPTSK